MDWQRLATCFACLALVTFAADVRALIRTTDGKERRWNQGCGLFVLLAAAALLYVAIGRG